MNISADSYNARRWEEANAQPDGEYHLTFHLTITVPADSEEEAIDNAHQFFAEQIPNFTEFTDPLDYHYTAERA